MYRGIEADSISIEYSPLGDVNVEPKARPTKPFLYSYIVTSALDTGASNTTPVIVAFALERGDESPPPPPPQELSRNITEKRDIKLPKVLKFSIVDFFNN